VDTTTALQQLFNLTGSLQPSPSADASVLRAARGDCTKSPWAGTPDHSRAAAQHPADESAIANRARIRVGRSHYDSSSEARLEAVLDFVDRCFLPPQYVFQRFNRHIQNDCVAGFETVGTPAIPTEHFRDLFRNLFNDRRDALRGRWRLCQGDLVFSYLRSVECFVISRSPVRSRRVAPVH